MSAINMDILKSYVGEDRALIKHFIDLFNSEMPIQLSELAIAIKQCDWLAASIIAHSIKSQVQYLGLTTVHQTAYQIEIMTQNEENTDQIASLFKSLENGIVEVISELKMLKL